MLARQTIGSGSSETSEEYSVGRVRLLLELVEQLEKAMYNASDGTATALIPPAKVSHLLNSLIMFVRDFVF